MSNFAPLTAVLLAALSFSACSSSPRCGEDAGYDLLVRGGHVVDGTGRPRFRADVAICRDRIAAVGLLAGARAADTIDATGLVVTPGFIDMLGQSEYTLLRDGRAVSKISQGITTEVTGEVTSVVPVNDSTLGTLPPSFRALVTWTDLDGYFAALERSGTAINLGTFVALGTVRQAVLGGADRAPTAAELEQMKVLVREAMQQGAMGVSAGLAYPPAAFASRSEVTELVRVAAGHGGGYATHLRSESDHLFEAVQEAIEIGTDAGTWVHIHHLKAAGRENWGRMGELVRLVEAARGVEVTADLYPYTASATSLDVVLPTWALAGGRDSLLSRLRDPLVRARLRAGLAARWEGWRSNGPGGGPQSITIAGVAEESLQGYVGERLDVVAGQRGQEPEDALLDLLVLDRARTSAVFHSMSERDVESALKQSWVGFGTDAGARGAYRVRNDRPHPRTFGSFPRVLGEYVRERGVLSLEEAVRRAAALPAARFRLEERGVLRAAYFADLTIFNPARVGDRATFEEPVRFPTGIPHVIVNGIPVLRDGSPTGARPGRALRRGGTGR